MKKLMNKLILASFILPLAINSINAQDDGAKKRDKITIKIGTDGLDVSKGNTDIIGHKNSKSKGKRNTSSMVMDLGFVNVLDDNSSTSGVNNFHKDLITKSINFNISKLHGISLYKKNVYLVTGLGLNVNNYRFSNNNLYEFAPALPNFNLYPNYSIIAANNVNIKKRKVATNYLTVPLMLQFKLGEGKRKFVVGGGLSAGYLLKGWQKAKFTDNKTKENISYAFNKFAINAIGEIGIDNRIRFYGSYALTPIYKTPLQGNALTFGLRFMGL